MLFQESVQSRSGLALAKHSLWKTNARNSLTVKNNTVFCGGMLCSQLHNLEIPAQFICQPWILSAVDGACRPDTRGDDPARVRPAQIFQQHLVMRQDGACLPSRRIGIGHQKHGFLGNMNAAVNGVETVNDGLELRGKTELVPGRGEGHQISGDNMFSNELKIVLKDARSVHAA